MPGQHGGMNFSGSDGEQQIHLMGTSSQGCRKGYSLLPNHIGGWQQQILKPQLICQLGNRTAMSSTTSPAFIQYTQKFGIPPT
jgi:hypothetical protein